MFLFISWYVDLSMGILSRLNWRGFSRSSFVCFWQMNQTHCQPRPLCTPFSPGISHSVRWHRFESTTLGGKCSQGNAFSGKTKKHRFVYCLSVLEGRFFSKLPPYWRCGYSNVYKRYYKVIIKVSIQSPTSPAFPLWAPRLPKASSPGFAGMLDLWPSGFLADFIPQFAFPFWVFYFLANSTMQLRRFIVGRLSGYLHFCAPENGNLLIS